MKIYLATWMLEKGQGIVLTKAKCKRRLLSYFHTAEKEELDRYVKTGKQK